MYGGGRRICRLFITKVFSGGSNFLYLFPIYMVKCSIPLSNSTHYKPNSQTCAKKIKRKIPWHSLTQLKR